MKKILSILLVLLPLVGALVACGGREPGPLALEGDVQSYIRLNQWDYHPSYQFLLTSVEEQGDNLLLRGVLARDVLTPEEVEAARAKGTIEINGETFIHTAVDIEGFMPTDRLYNVDTGTELFLVIAFFGEFEGDDIRYRMTKNHQQVHHHFFKITEMYREVEIDKNTPVEIWRRVDEQRESGTNVFFEPMETTAHVFYDYTENYLPDGFPFGGSFLFIFENGKCTFLRWLP